MEKAKRVSQKNVPLNQQYILVGSFYQSMEDGGGCICENCGRIITNVATIQGVTDGRQYSIGMDCAETITSIRDGIEFIFAKGSFSQAKSARATILKAIKKSKELGVEYKISARTDHTAKNFYKEIGTGVWYFTPQGEYSPRQISQNWKQYQKDVWSNHVLPMISDLLTVPLKTGESQE